MTRYNFENIRALLIRGFSDEELRRICYDVPDFRPVYDSLARQTGKAEIVDRLIEHAEAKLLIETLLTLAQKLNPRRFEKHQPYYDFTPVPATPSSIFEKPQAEVASVIIPSWVLNLPQPQPILHSHSGINAALRGYTPFANPGAEYELEYLFGKVGCFWSQHPAYAVISAAFYPQVVVAPTGSGKTAFASALTQIGNVEGNPLEGSFPISISGNPRTVKEMQGPFTYALLNFVQVNSSILLALSVPEQQFLLRLLVNGLGIDIVTVRLAQATRTSRDLANLIEQAGHRAKFGHTQWLSQVQQCLALLGFERAILAIDFNQSGATDLKFWSQNILRWATYALIIKLFLPENLGQQLSKISDQVELLSLTWHADQIAAMVQWRFESLARLTGIRANLEFLFDDSLYPQFLAQAQGNPGRLARLWRYLFEDHLNFSPIRSTFISDNLARAVEKLK
jgi:hypothetical protein